jgi:hypothetical protein
VSRKRTRRLPREEGGPGSVTTAEGQVTVRGGVSATTGRGFCQFDWEGRTAQFTPADARQLALHLLEAAAAAEQDAAVWLFAREGIGLDAQQAAVMVEGVRGAAPRAARGCAIPEPPDEHRAEAPVGAP